MSSRNACRRRALQLGFALLLALGCSAAPSPPVVPGIEGAAHDVLVFVPGIMGSHLVHPDGHSAWGKGLDVLWPRDGGREVALPLTRDHADDGDTPLTPTTVLESIGILGYRQEFYVKLRRSFEANGYVVGDPRRPDARSNLYLFAHDFRLGPEVVAAQLGELTARIQEARGGGSLDVNLLCQSNGGNVCRYFARFGGATLEEAEAGDGRFPEGVRIEKLALVGTANAGAIRMLREFDIGRRILETGTLGRRFAPETLMTFRSLFVELPDRPDNFVSPSGEALSIDVYDPAAWEENGWGVWSASARKRLRARRWSAYADLEDWRRHLELQLDRARRLRRLLDVGTSKVFATEAILQVQSKVFETPRRAVVDDELAGRRRIRFWGDESLEELGGELRAAAMIAGDGHATEDGLALSRQESDVEHEIVFLDDRHAELALSPEAHVAVLRFLAQP